MAIRFELTAMTANTHVKIKPIFQKNQILLPILAGIFEVAEILRSFQKKYHNFKLSNFSNTIIKTFSYQ